MVDTVVWVKATANRRVASGHGFYLQHAKEVRMGSSCVFAWCRSTDSTRTASDVSLPNTDKSAELLTMALYPSWLCLQLSDSHVELATASSQSDSDR